MKPKRRLRLAVEGPLLLHHQRPLPIVNPVARQIAAAKGVKHRIEDVPLVHPEFVRQQGPARQGHEVEHGLVHLELNVGAIEGTVEFPAVLSLVCHFERPYPARAFLNFNLWREHLVEDVNEAVVRLRVGLQHGGSSVRPLARAT